MDVKIDNKDIVLTDCGVPQYIDGIDEIVQRVKIACSVKKGSFLYDRELGSYAHTVDLSQQSALEKLEMIYKEASIDIPYTDLKVLSVNTEDKEKSATIQICCGTKTVTTEVTING